MSWFRTLLAFGGELLAISGHTAHHAALLLSGLGRLGPRLVRSGKSCFRYPSFEPSPRNSLYWFRNARQDSLHSSLLGSFGNKPPPGFR
jgi:hypothetical protein